MPLKQTKSVLVTLFNLGLLTNNTSNRVIYGINRLFTASCNSLSLFLRLEPFVYIGNDKKGTQIRTGILIGTTTLHENVK